MEENYQQILDKICRGKVKNMKYLSTPIKNKLIDIAEYSFRKQIGNVILSQQILSNLNLQDIYLNRKQRINLSSNLKNSLKVIKDIEDGKQCKNELERYVNFKKYISSGSFGEVSIGNIIDGNQFDFAIKMAKITKEVNPHLETHIARLLNDLVFKGIAQNLPIMVDSFNCDSCNFKNLRDIRRSTDAKCIFTINEIANGDLTNWLQTNPSKEELESCLFQIMAGIHALQYHYLLLNNDMKAPNILFYNVNPGGYWKYTIYGTDFYVPNYGKLFIVNDFGVSEIFAPKYQFDYGKEGRLGGRVFMINKGRFDVIENELIEKVKSGCSSKINWNNGTKSNYNPIKFVRKTNKINYPPILTLEQKRYLSLNPNNLDFYNSNLVPPLELISDTQDVIKIFFGGLRMSQFGGHQRFNISEEFRLSLEPYLMMHPGSGFMSLLCTEHLKFSTDLSKILAGYFILNYFTNVVDYTVQKSRDVVISHIKTSSAENIKEEGKKEEESYKKLNGPEIKREKAELSKLTMKKLKEIAKERGRKNYHNLDKKELINMIICGNVWCVEFNKNV